MARWRRHLAAPVDGSSLAAFRMAFGVLMLIGVIRFFAYGWIAEQYIEPSFWFSYQGLAWLQPWPAWGMYAHFAALGVLALCIALGLYTRVSAALFFVGFTYVELLDKTNYLNHYYLVSILALLMVFMPLGGSWSLDARWRGKSRGSQVPRWCVWALRLQIGLVYFFAGVAKLRPDWLLHAQPLTIWLAARADLPLVGPLLAIPETAYAASWFGAIFDLTFPFWMLSKRTRPYALSVCVVFHLVTGVLFHIGMFPWIMVSAALIFFSPDWPRRLLRRAPAPPAAPFRPPALSPYAGALLALFFVVQAILPLRKHIYPGDVAWTEAGFRFSWHVMVAEKAGAVWFRVRDVDSGRRYLVDPHDYLSPRQHKMMSTSPDMIVQLAHHIAEDFHARGHKHVEVRAEAYAALNGRRSAPLLADVDLLATDPIAAATLRP